MSMLAKMGTGKQAANLVVHEVGARIGPKHDALVEDGGW